MFKINNKNSRATSLTWFWCVFVVNFERISHIFCREPTRFLVNLRTNLSRGKISIRWGAVFLKRHRLVFGWANQPTVHFFIYLIFIIIIDWLFPSFPSTSDIEVSLWCCQYKWCNSFQRLVPMHWKPDPWYNPLSHLSWSSAKNCNYFFFLINELVMKFVIMPVKPRHKKNRGLW